MRRCRLRPDVCTAFVHGDAGATPEQRMSVPNDLTLAAARLIPHRLVNWSPSTQLRAPRRTSDSVWMLEHFGIPWACYDARGDLLAVSQSICWLFGDSAPEALEHATKLVARLLALDAGNATSLIEHRVAVPGTDGRTVLQARYLPSSDGAERAAVVFLAAPSEGQTSSTQSWGLSRREAEVASEISAGRSTKAIAFRLGISPHTVRRHTERVFAKLGVSSRSHIVAMFAAHSHSPQM